MPFIKQTSSKNMRASNLTRRIFIGRRSVLEFFVQNILRPDNPSHNIISISGQGGVGKSTLLTQFIEIANSDEFKDYSIVSLVDEHQTTPASVMERLADQLHIAGEFEKSLKLYKDALRKLQNEQNSARDTLTTKVASDIGGALVKEVPGIGSFLEKEAGTAVGYLIGEIRYRQRLKDTERLEDPIANLTKNFINELNILVGDALGRRHRVILFFDTFEQLAPEVTPWLLDYFLPANISNNVVLVVAGRDPIEHSTPGDSKRWLPYFDNNTIYPIFLESFTEAETSEYLKARGITDDDQFNMIWQLSQGLPLYISLLTSNPQGKVDPTTDVVDNYLRWIPEHEEVRRRIALDSALLSKPFNQDDMDAFKYLPENDRFMLYKWLITLPFVQSIPQDGRHIYHKLTQQLFCRHLYHRSQKEYYATRRALADYYQQLLDNSLNEGDSEIYASTKRIELVLALIYQLLALSDEDSHIRAIELMLRVYEYTKQTGEMINILREVCQEQPNNLSSLSARKVAKQLLRYFEIDSVSSPHEKVNIASDLLEKLNRAASFSSELLTRIYLARGTAYAILENYEFAISDFSHVLTLNSKDTATYILRGDAYLAIGEYKKSISDYDQALSLNSEVAETLTDRATAYFRLHEFQKAIQDLNQALEIDPQHTFAYIIRGLAFFVNKDFQKAIQDLNQALKMDPQHALAYFIRSLIYSHLKKQKQALKDLNKMMNELSLTGEKHLPFAFIYVLQGQIYNSLNKHRLALESIDQALELNPDFAPAYSVRGMIYSSLKKHQQAIEEFDTALDYEPLEADTLVLRGNEYKELKKYQRAIQDFSLALELDPNNYLAYTSRGNYYMELRQYEHAIQDFNQLLKLTPADAQVYAARGRAYILKKQYEHAIQDFNQLLELTPQDSQTYASRGQAHFFLRQFEQALQDLNQAIRLDHKNAQAYLIRGNTYYHQKQHEKALQDLNRTVTLMPRSSLAYSIRASIYVTMKKYQQAFNDISRAFELDSKNVEAYVAQAEYYNAQEKYQQALEDINQALILDPDNYTAHAVRGALLVDYKKEYQAAIAECNYVIEYKLEEGPIYYLRGLAHLWLNDIRAARDDFTHSFEIDQKNVNFGWAAEWTDMCLENNDSKRLERLLRIAAIEPQIQTAHICRGVALWLGEHFEEAKKELELAISLNPETGGAQFWKGMAYVTLNRDAEAKEAFEKSKMVNNPIPPALLASLELLKYKRPDFYEEYAAPFLAYR